MHKLYKPEEATKEYNFEETCPHCDTAVPVLIDDDCYEYSAICPVCGEKIMLCTLCMWEQEDDENAPGDCDWTEERGCYRAR